MTPVIKIPYRNHTIYFKLEFLHRSGSIKQRFIDYFFKHNLNLLKDKILFEASTGNTGIGLAMKASELGLKSIISVPSGISSSYVERMIFFGSKVIVCDNSLPPDHQLSFHVVARQLSRKMDGIFLDQFSNHQNVECHYFDTSEEILSQVPHIDALVAPAGSGGTLMGCSKRLREKFPGMKVIGLESKGSVLSGKSNRLDGEHLSGIGNTISPPILDGRLINHWVTLDHDLIRKSAIDFSRRFGLLLGLSSAASILGAMIYADNSVQPLSIISILPDGGRESNFRSFREQNPAISYPHLITPQGQFPMDEYYETLLA
jgi:cysteine synthase A